MTGKAAIGELNVEDAASRASAFVYGNVLVLAALIALHPGSLNGPTGVLYVLGTGLSTFIAHLVGEIVGDRIREGQAPSWSRFSEQARNAVPIASSASMPAALLAAAWFGWLPAWLALAAAEGVTVARVAFLGMVISNFSGERSSWRAIASGIVLAVVCAIAAGLKWSLTH